jgi:hypothetical protein
MQFSTPQASDLHLRGRHVLINQKAIVIVHLWKMDKHARSLSSFSEMEAENMILPLLIRTSDIYAVGMEEDDRHRYVGH